MTNFIIGVVVAFVLIEGIEAAAKRFRLTARTAISISLTLGVCWGVIVMLAARGAA